MRLTAKMMVSLEMDLADFRMLQDVLGQASQVRSKKFPMLNTQAARIGELLAHSEYSIFQTDFSEAERKVMASMSRLLGGEEKDATHE